jgi:hypothetical protein
VFAEGFYTEGPAEGPDGRIYFCDITPTFRHPHGFGQRPQPYPCWPL